MASRSGVRHADGVGLKRTCCVSAVGWLCWAIRQRRVLLMAGSRSAAISMLRGRRHELAVREGLLDAARAGQSGVLALLGQAGIGKTALLEGAIESASDFTLLRAVGVESEMKLAFAGRHRLCAPVLDSVGRLAAPQSEALRVTFGVTAGPAPDRPSRRPC